MITLTTYATVNYAKNCVELCQQSMEVAAANSGGTITCDFPCVFTNAYATKRYPSWYKLAVLATVLDRTESDWVVWLDADSVVVNPNYKLDAWFQSLPNFVNCVFAHDWNGLCACFFALRRCQWSRDFLSTLDFIGTVPGPGGTYEQATIKWFVANAAEHHHRFTLAPTTLAHDQTIFTDRNAFSQHFSNFDGCRRLQEIVLNGGRVGGMPHGIQYS